MLRTSLWIVVVLNILACSDHQTVTSTDASQSDTALLEARVADGIGAPDVSHDMSGFAMPDSRWPDGQAVDVPTMLDLPAAPDIRTTLDVAVDVYNDVSIDRHAINQGDSDANAESTCNAYIPQALPHAVANTPRKNEVAEILALEASGQFVTPDSLYERVMIELVAIEKADPSVVGLKPLSPQTQSSYLIIFDEVGWGAYQAGNYHAWDCQNLAYGMKTTEVVSDRLKIAELNFGNKRFNLPLFIKEYSALPNIRDVTPNQSGDGSDVCLEVQGDVHFYIYDRASGDCLAGCTQHLYTAFRVTADALVTKLGTFAPGSGLTPPNWFNQLLDCRNYL